MEREGCNDKERKWINNIFKYWIYLMITLIIEYACPVIYVYGIICLRTSISPSLIIIMYLSNQMGLKTNIKCNERWKTLSLVNDLLTVRCTIFTIYISIQLLLAATIRSYSETISLHLFALDRTFFHFVFVAAATAAHT